MSWREFEKVAQNYPYKLPRIFSMIDDEMLLGTSDIAELTGVTKETVRSWCRQGKLRVASPIGKKVIYGDDLKEFMFERFKNDFIKA
ncbi:helix-turn-helix domain-containing protein [Bacillus sp. MUM 116]|uniref:helix-turn-helix domain-containing protein n=1 Tax=Bacillus sp. MUM 116 TaxID=1678002 RepID=UPI0015A5F2BE|nr:helix-turn-helix domain-containing protein [Bacillus sp. MUM 116]